MPSPIDTELRIHDSPVPTHTVCGLLGSIAIAPIDCTGCLSNTGLTVVPPSCDFHTPPDAAPMYSRVLPPTTRPATAAIRPLIVAEPMLRAPSPEITPPSRIARSVGAGGATAAAIARGSPGPAVITAATGVFGAGSLNHASSAATLASARSMVMWLLRGPPLPPDSNANGNHTPLTCW